MNPGPFSTRIPPGTAGIRFRFSRAAADFANLRRPPVDWHARTGEPGGHSGNPGRMSICLEKCFGERDAMLLTLCRLASTNAIRFRLETIPRASAIEISTFEAFAKEIVTSVST